MPLDLLTLGCCDITCQVYKKGQGHAWVSVTTLQRIVCRGSYMLEHAQVLAGVRAHARTRILSHTLCRPACCARQLGVCLLWVSCYCMPHMQWEQSGRAIITFIPQCTWQQDFRPAYQDVVCLPLSSHEVLVCMLNAACRSVMQRPAGHLRSPAAVCSKGCRPDLWRRKGRGHQQEHCRHAGDRLLPELLHQ